jgi:hypothetical protein
MSPSGGSPSFAYFLLVLALIVVHHGIELFDIMLLVVVFVVVLERIDNRGGMGV